MSGPHCGVGSTPHTSPVWHSYGLNRDPEYGALIAYVARPQAGRPARRTDSCVAARRVVDEVVIGVLVGEVVVKIGAEGRRPLEYFHDRWNLLDFAIALISVVSLEARSAGSAGGTGSQTVLGLRVVRLLRVLKLMRIVPKMRILVMALFASIASIAYIGLLLVLLFYLYGIIGAAPQTAPPAPATGPGRR